MNHERTLKLLNWLTWSCQRLCSKICRLPEPGELSSRCEADRPAVYPRLDVMTVDSPQSTVGRSAEAAGMLTNRGRPQVAIFGNKRR